MYHVQFSHQTTALVSDNNKIAELLAIIFAPYIELLKLIPFFLLIVNKPTQTFST